MALFLRFYGITGDWPFERREDVLTRLEFPSESGKTDETGARYICLNSIPPKYLIEIKILHHIRLPKELYDLLSHTPCILFSTFLLSHEKL